MNTYCIYNDFHETTVIMNYYKNTVESFQSLMGYIMKCYNTVFKYVFDKLK